MYTKKQKQNTLIICLITLVLLILISIFVYKKYAQKHGIKGEDEGFKNDIVTNNPLVATDLDNISLQSQVRNLQQQIREINNDSLTVEQPLDYEPTILRNGVISQRTLKYAEQPYLNAQFNGINTMEGLLPVPFRGNDIAITGAGQIIRNPQEINALDRVFNPLRYPYKSPDFYQYGFYPDMTLPAEVIGGGYRNTPTYGGSQVPILNPLPSVPINNLNIAPVNISTRGPLGTPQAIGILYKVNAPDNQVLPLFGRRRYPNGNRYDYYTIMGDYNVKVPVVTKNRNIELGTNDLVFIKGIKFPYRVSLYENDFPQYIPYM